MKTGLNILVVIFCSLFVVTGCQSQDEGAKKDAAKKEVKAKDSDPKEKFVPEKENLIIEKLSTDLKLAEFQRVRLYKMVDKYDERKKVVKAKGMNKANEAAKLKEIEGKQLEEFMTVLKPEQKELFLKLQKEQQSPAKKEIKKTDVVKGQKNKK